MKSIKGGILSIETSGTNVGYFTKSVAGFNNATGSTAETKLKLLEGPKSDINGAIFSLQDGRREGRMSFFPEYIKILDRNDVKASLWMDTTGDFHTYRIAMVEDRLRVYVDGEEVASVILSNQVKEKQVRFGDFSNAMGENMSAKVDYLAYSVEGAIAPEAP